MTIIIYIIGTPDFRYQYSLERCEYVNVSCSGTEDQLDDCTLNASISINSSYIAYVSCAKGKDTIVSFSIYNLHFYIVIVTEIPSIRGNSIETKSFQLNWSPPTETTCQETIGYTVQCWNAMTNAIVYSQNHHSSFSTVSGLTPCTNYGCSVTAYNDYPGQNQTEIINNIRTNSGTYAS